jgi:hypothetical protein
VYIQQWCALCSCCCLASNRFVLILTCSLFVSLGAHLVSESQICSIISQPRWTNIKNVALACLSLSLALVRLAGSLRYDTRDAARANTNNLMRVCVHCVKCKIQESELSACRWKIIHKDAPSMQPVRQIDRIELDCIIWFVYKC